MTTTPNAPVPPARVLVLGGTAWLGAEVARQAVAAGHEVTCLARGSGGGAPAGARLVRADRDLPGAYDDVAGRFDLVVDVARQPGQVRSAVAALADRATRWAFVSTVNVYADDTAVGGDESAARHGPYDGDVAPAEAYGPAKVACEDAVLAALGERALLARAGLLVGPGDPSGRFGYWPRRHARGGDVLVPGAGDQIVQLLDVRDLAAWLLTAGLAGVAGAYDAVGEPRPLVEVLAEVRTTTAAATGTTSRHVPVDPAWLLEQGVRHWTGERSLPLWLPAEMAGFCSRTGAAARAAGLATRPLAGTVRDLLAEPGAEPLGTAGAGLTPADETALLAAWARARAPRA